MSQKHDLQLTGHLVYAGMTARTATRARRFSSGVRGPWPDNGSSISRVNGLRLDFRDCVRNERGMKRR